MKNLILVLALTGCSGESFTGFTSGGSAETDGGFEKIAAGGSGDDGGVLTGGAAGAVGTATGGVPGSGGVTVEAGGATTVGTGGSPGTGGTPNSGGTTGTGGVTVVTGGSPGTGGLIGTGGGSGGATATGGVTGTGGATNTSVCCSFPLTSGTTMLSCDVSAPWYCVGAQTYSCAQQGQCTSGMACYNGSLSGTVVPCAGSTCDKLVTHSNGLGQTWQDCVPLNTYNESQATKACKAAGAAKCVSSPTCNGVVYGYDTTGTQIYGGSWGYGGSGAGYAVPAAKLGGGACPGPAVVGVQAWR